MSDKLNKNKKIEKSDGNTFRNKLCLVGDRSNVFQETNDILILEDDLEDMNIQVPRNDDLTSSSDDSDFEFFNYKDHRKTLTTLADAIRMEFLQKLPFRSKQGKQHSTTAFKANNRYKALPMPSENEASSFSNPSSGTSSGLVQCELNSKSTEENVKLTQTFNCLSSEAILEESDLRVDAQDLETGSQSSLKLQKITEDDQTSFHQSCGDSSGLATTKRNRKDLVVSLALSEPPKNALVLYWGRINMTPKELRSLNLSRCIKVLLEEDHYEFVLLQIQGRKFILEYCDTSSPSEFSAQKMAKNKRKKSLTEVIRNGGKDLLRKPREDNVQLLQEKRPSKSHLFSCIGLPGSLSRSTLQHNDSLCLRSYDLLKRKRIVEFDYKRIVYCGVEERSIPNNMLVWIFYAEYGNYSAVECHCVECDDQSHARQLSRALASEISRFNH